MMKNHLISHHPGIYLDPEKNKSANSQSSLENFVRTKKCPTERSNKITRRIAEMVAMDMRPIQWSRKWERREAFVLPIK